MSALTPSKTRGDWTYVEFGDVVRQIRDEVSPEEAGVDRFVAGEHMDSNDLVLRRWGAIGDGYLGPAFRRRFRRGQVLYGSRRTYLRKISIAGFDGICANTTFVLEPADDRLSSALLPHVMQCESFHAHSIARSRGSVNPYVTWKDIASYGFLLPPRHEQDRIAEVLGASLGTSEGYRAAAERLNVAMRARLAALSAPDKESRIVRLSDVCSMQNGRPFPSSEYRERGAPLLRPGNLDATGYLSWTAAATKHLPNEYLVEASDFIVRPGDVVINLTAQSLEDGFMGRVCLAREGDESLLNQRIGRFLCRDDMLPEYLFRALQTPVFRRRAESRCTGSKIRHLYWAHIEDFDFPLPPLGRQAEVVDELKDVDAARREVESHRSKLAVLSVSLRERLLCEASESVH